MQVTSTTNNIYTSNTNKLSQSKHLNEDDESKRGISLEELLDEDGYAFFNELLVGVPDKEQINITLMLSFMLNVKGENFVDGEIHMQRETSKPDTQSILSKLERLSKSKNRTNEMNYVINELKAFYTDKVQNNISINEQEESVIDDFLEDLYSKKSIEFASTLVKEDMKNKVDEYAKILGEELGDTEKFQIIDDYKQELLKEYKEILEAISDETPSLKQQGIMKALLDENDKEISSLESLLTNKM